MTPLVVVEDMVSSTLQQKDYLSVPIEQASVASHVQEVFGTKKIVVPELTNIELKRLVASYVFDHISKKHSGQAAIIARAVLMAARQYQMDPLLLVALIRTESKFNPHAKGKHGEIGLMQIKPETAAWVARKNKIPWRGADELRNSEYNIRLGVAYLAMLRKKFSHHSRDYLAAYNMGSKKLRNLKKQGNKPKEYADKIMSYYEFLRGQALAQSPVSHSPQI